MSPEASNNFMSRNKNSESELSLRGERLVLRTLTAEDFNLWRDVRNANYDWLAPWEPIQNFKNLNGLEDLRSFSIRCANRKREMELGTGWGFGIFSGDSFIGEINMSNVVRGAFQSAHVGYWIDGASAGYGYMPESLVALMKFAFEKLNLHRIQISIVPRNLPSRRVVEKLDLRCEGLAERYLEINGKWEDHLRYAITSEEWSKRGSSLSAKYLGLDIK